MSWAEVPFTPSVDSSEPTPEEVGRVEKVLSEADDDDYWFAASKDGNRISHYRGNVTLLLQAFSSLSSFEERSFSFNLARLL